MMQKRSHSVPILFRVFLFLPFLFTFVGCVSGEGESKAEDSVFDLHDGLQRRVYPVDTFDRVEAEVAYAVKFVHSDSCRVEIFYEEQAPLDDVHVSVDDGELYLKMTDPWDDEDNAYHSRNMSREDWDHFEDYVRGKRFRHALIVIGAPHFSRIEVAGLSSIRFDRPLVLDSGCVLDLSGLFSINSSGLNSTGPLKIKGEGMFQIAVDSVQSEGLTVSLDGMLRSRFGYVNTGGGGVDIMVDGMGRTRFGSIECGSARFEAEGLAWIDVDTLESSGDVRCYDEELSRVRIQRLDAQGEVRRLTDW